ncbi:VOC family protein [Shimazuella alba]|uniref:VOC family protein n=1 Tax=Shimazuella alba TaxID=2690964 RepID=A0A6I4VZ01_9BACL|nr:VOC family protein [Shimazuella alba]
MQKINPCLWFNYQAEEAVHFYLSIFKNSKIVNTSYYPEKKATANKTVMSITFELDGNTFIAFNGGPHFTFSPAVSFYVNCYSQKEVDELWERLSDGGKKGECGRLEDKFGVTWQIAPIELIEKLNDPDPQKAYRTMKSILRMGKIEIDRL